MGERHSAPRGKTVLLAEHDVYFACAIEAYLQRDGYRVLVARDGVEGVTVARANGGQIDLVLADIMLPRLHVFEMVGHIKHLRPDVHVLYILAGTPSPELELLQKPLVMRELLDAVRRRIGRSNPRYQAATL